MPLVLASFSAFVVFLEYFYVRPGEVVTSDKKILQGFQKELVETLLKSYYSVF